MMLINYTAPPNELPDQSKQSGDNITTTSFLVSFGDVTTNPWTLFKPRLLPTSSCRQQSNLIMGHQTTETSRSTRQRKGNICIKFDCNNYYYIYSFHFDYPYMTFRLGKCARFAFLIWPNNALSACISECDDDCQLFMQCVLTPHAFLCPCIYVYTPLCALTWPSSTFLRSLIGSHIYVQRISFPSSFPFLLSISDGGIQRNFILLDCPAI